MLVIHETDEQVASCVTAASDAASYSRDRPARGSVLEAGRGSR